MTQIQNSKRYDLEDRTLRFAQRVIAFASRVPGTLANVEVARQLVRSAGSVGANYIEANESLSKKDFVVRVKICRKEAKESAYWLKLATTDNEGAEKEKPAWSRKPPNSQKSSAPFWKSRNDVLNFVLWILSLFRISDF